MSIKKMSFMLLGALSLAALLNGCGSDSKEGNLGGVARVGEGTCRTCHSDTLDPKSGTSLVADFITSAHNTDALGCQGCHGGGAQHNGVGPIPFPDPAAAGQCVVCHSTAYAPLFTLAVDFVGNKCGSCHTDGGNRGVHGAKATSTEDCVSCHDVSAPAHSATSNDGVRSITGEFAKRSHHVTGRALNSTDCAVCHLEGEGSTGTVLINRAMHMNSGIINLRNGNIGLTGNQTKSTAVDGTAWTTGNGKVGYAWNPATPDHTLMDQFCFSCHNAAGAPAAVVALELVPSVTGFTRTALNPFGDSVSNDYDQVSRINVVGVYEQFAITNSSHHAVRGQKYTSNNLTAAQFTNISTANFNNQVSGVPTPIRGVKNTPDVFNPTTGLIQTAGVKTGTMFETGKFTTTYTTLNNTAVADNSILHCGDCHTVGQFRAADVNTAAGSFNKVAIGAHGSNNEYMLRNSNGDDTFAKDALVCYLCHKENLYSVPDQTLVNTAASQEDEVVAHNSVNNSFADCNGNNENSSGLIGRARLVPEEREMDDATFQAEVAAGTYQPTGGGNIFGIKCANCHNASDKKTFGGIHGNAGNASYISYSGAKNVNGAVTTVSRKPFRFLPGLGNFRYNGGDSADQWTVRTLAQANKQGCYTLNGASTVTRGTARVANPSPTRADAAGANVSALAIAGDNGLLGSWGACTDHAGTSVFGGRATTRTLLRPLTY